LPNEKTPKEREDAAKKYAKALAKIDKMYFDKLSLAIALRDKDTFLKTCKEAGVPQSVLNDLQPDIDYLKAEEGWGGGWGGGWG